MDEVFESHKPKTVKITENTVIPLSMVVIVCSVVVYIATAVSSSAYQKDRIEKMEAVQEKNLEFMHQVSERLSRIEGALGVKENAK